MTGLLVKRALIIAAGRGIRLNTHSQDVPKCLISVGSRSIIETILLTLRDAGIEEAIIVTGYKHEAIEERLGDGSGIGLRLRYIHNDRWQKKNGLSVYAARNFFDLDEQFLLTMSDHLFASEVLTTLMSFQLGPGETALAVDSKVDSIVDIEDATKVVCKESTVRQIGKELKEYNGVDCGLFKCTTGLFDALEAAMIDGDCSLTDGCRQLIASEKMRAADIGKTFWIDIDTPQALANAISKLELSGHGVSPR